MTLEDKINVIYNWVLAQQKEQQIDICNIIKEEGPTYAELAEDVVIKLGVSRSLVGFRYLVWVVEQVANDEEKLRNVTKDLYITGAEHFDTNSKAFGRAIKHATDSAFREPAKPTPEAVRLFGDSRPLTEYRSKAVIATLAAEVKKRKKYGIDI